jgi:alkylhydroperoxidase/carboxymuconolactone decarboxylase family protein
MTGSPEEHFRLQTDAIEIFQTDIILLLGGLMDSYYDPKDLAKFEEVGEDAPELAKKFFEYYGAVFAEGELSRREKALIALAVAHTIQCPYCIDAYTQDCLEKGSNASEMMEAVHVATAIRGGASLVHGTQMRKIVKKLSM